MVKESVMPRARNAPILGSTSRIGRCMIWTSVVRKTKQSTIATRSVIAIFTIVQRRSSRCSRNGFEVSLSGASRNRKMSRSVIGSVENSARTDAREHRQRVGITDLLAGDHPFEFGKGEFATVEDCFRVMMGVAIGAASHRPGQNKKRALVGKPWRGKEITQQR